MGLLPSSLIPGQVAYSGTVPDHGHTVNVGKMFESEFSAGMAFAARYVAHNDAASSLGVRLWVVVGPGW